PGAVDGELQRRRTAALHRRATRRRRHRRQQRLGAAHVLLVERIPEPGDAERGDHPDDDHDHQNLDEREASSTHKDSSHRCTITHPVPPAKIQFFKEIPNLTGGWMCCRMLHLCKLLHYSMPYRSIL